MDPLNNLLVDARGRTSSDGYIIPLKMYIVILFLEPLLSEISLADYYQFRNHADKYDRLMTSFF